MPKVLIIDDIEDNLISLSALLKALIPNITLYTALSGEEGLSITLKELMMNRNNKIEMLPGTERKLK